MNYKRREFLKMSGSLAAAFAAAPLAGKFMEAEIAKSKTEQIRNTAMDGENGTCERSARCTETIGW